MKKQSISRWLTMLLTTMILVSGCRSRECFVADPNANYLPFAQQIEVAGEDACHEPLFLDIDTMGPPPTVRRADDYEKWPLSLQEAIEIALANSQVIRDIGGRVITSAATAPTVFDPALQEANPRTGVEAALSAFDTQFGVRLFHQQTDRKFNNIFFGSTGSLVKSSDFRMGLDKVAATGTQFTAENITAYSNNQNFDPNNPGGNRFASTYDTYFQLGFRHPLLQGGGVDFNRIAGPNATPGNYNGVLIARINSDISLADFEAAIRNLVRDIEQTYWELYFAYRDFETKKSGRDLALGSWELASRRFEVGTESRGAEAFAREQYYLAQVGAENALSGRSNGGGIYSVERQLRSLLGLPTSDGRLILPSDTPSTVDVQFDWHESLAYSLTRRVELRRQQWQVKRRELEVAAARNFQKMRLDFIGQYRWRGFGDELFGEEFRPEGSAFADLFDGDLQGWTLGLELRTPVGNRIGHTAARHAELALARERAAYDELERQITHQLRAAYTELDRSYMVSRSNFNRRVATSIRLEEEEERYDRGNRELDFLIDAQRQAVLAEVDYHRAVVDYNLALMDMYYSRGTLLDRHGVRLAEGAWSDAAHRSAAKLARRYWEKTNYCFTTPGPISQGTYPQDMSDLDASDIHTGVLPADGSPTLAEPMIPEVNIDETNDAAEVILPEVTPMRLPDAE